MKISILKTISVLTLILFTLNLKSQKNCFPRKVNKLVYDETGTLSSNQADQLNYKLINYANSTSTQILVVIVADLCGMDAAMYTTELGHKWGVGQGDKDNGAVIMVKPTRGPDQRKVHIATGYGLEGVIPDAIAKRIVENEMIPRFKNGDIYGGINAATNVIMELAAGEYPAEEYVKRNSGGSPLPFFFIILFVIFFMMVSRVSRTRRYARNNNMSFWLALLLMNSSMNRHRGHYGNFSSGRGSFGGFGGGGFGGFGGGGFGGGGAGGSW